jgi:hypothetical protein
MRCPRCESTISSPVGRDACIEGVEVLIVVCPHCDIILGVVHRSHSAYFSKRLPREMAT